MKITFTATEARALILEALTTYKAELLREARITRPEFNIDEYDENNFMIVFQSDEPERKES